MIEQGSDGEFAVCVREKPWLLCSGWTEKEVIEDFKEFFEEQVDWYKEDHDGQAPDWAYADIEYRL